MKFYRSNQASANIFFMVGIDTQPNQNFFLHDFSNHLSTSGDNFAKRVLLAKFSQVPTEWGAFTGLSDAASIDSTGTRVPTPNFPFQVVMRPTRQVSTRILSHNPTNDKFFVLNQLTEIPAGTALWDVYATDAPAPPGQNSSFIQIGSIITDSEVVLSLYGDNTLFFQHQLFDQDIKLRPEWLSNCSELKKCLSCNDPVNGRTCF